MPPFKSNAQRKFLYTNYPKIAKEYEKNTPKDKKLVERVEKPLKQGKLKRIGKI